MSLVKTEQTETECPECGGMVASADGETFCRSCGLVVNENKIDHREKYTDITKRVDKNRGTGLTGNATHDKGLGSQISFRNRDANKNELSSKKRARLSRLRDWQEKYQFDTSQTNARSGLGEVNRLSAAMGFGSDVNQTAAQLFKQAQEQNLLIGRGIDGIANVAVFIASRLHGYRRPMSEWEEYMSIDMDAFKNRLSTVQEELDIGYVPSVPLDYFDEVCDKFRLTKSKRNKARNLVKKGQKAGKHTGKKPRVFVGGAIYVVDGYVTQEEIADKLGCAINTVRNRIGDLKDLDH